MTTSCTSSLSLKFFPARCFFRCRNKRKLLGYHRQQQFVSEFPLNVHLLRWENVRRNAARIWQDSGSALPFQTHLTQTKPVLPLSNEHGSQVKDEGQRQCCHNKHKKISLSAYTWGIFTFRTRLVVGYTIYVCVSTLYDIHTTMKLHDDAFLRTHPSLSNAWLYCANLKPHINHVRQNPLGWKPCQVSKEDATWSSMSPKYVGNSISKLQIQVMTYFWN